MTRREELERNLAAVRARIADACRTAGREPDELTLIAITKFFPAPDVTELAWLGVHDMGENRDQEALPKVAELPPAVRESVTVHFVGQLQTNKANRVARYADVVQSVDRGRLVNALDRGVATALERGERHTRLGVTIQVDLDEGAADHRGRGGALPEEVPALADLVAQTEHLDLRGVMAVAPFGVDEAATAAAFERLARIAEALRADHPGATWMSAGMSGDLEQAIAAGATHLRVGTAILGSRPSPR